MLRVSTLILMACLAFVCFPLTPTAALDTIWDFNGNLTATSGTATMSYRGDTSSIVSFFGSEHELGLPMPFGDNSGLMRIPSTSPTQGLAINLNNGGATVQDYTMIWDLFRPGPSWDSWLPLYQTNINNTDDGDFFINPGDGIGISGQYHGTVASGLGSIGWNRIAVTRSADGTMKKYVDGSLVGTQSAAGSRWDITGGQFDILTDEDNESSLAFLSSFRFVDNVLSDSTIANLGAVHAGGTGVSGKQIAANPATMTPGGYTVAFLGDTQNYSQFYPQIFNQVTQWFVDNKAARNIQFVVQDGDIVNSYDNSSSEWNNARAAMQKLDGVIPYAVVRGNHDCAGGVCSVSSQYDLATRFGPGSPYSLQPTLTDHFEVPGQPNWDMRNTAHKFDVGNQKFMVVTLDISAGSNVVAWANSVIAANPDRRVILDTHAYSYDGGQRFNRASDPENPGLSFDQSRDLLLRPGSIADEAVYNGYAYGGQDAETLWNNLVKLHPNISLVLSGHQFENYDSFKYHVEEGISGNRVYELLVDPQVMANGGNGWTRLLEFDPDGLTVHVKTYSPYLNQWDTAADNFFDIRLSPILPGDFNNDLTVDAADYVLWRDGLGTSYSEADYQVWRAHFGHSALGSGAGTFASIPEPTPLILLTLAAMIGMMRRTPSPR